MKKFAFLPFIFILIGCMTCNLFDSQKIFQPGCYKGTYSITHYYNTDSSFTDSGPATFIFTDTSYSCWGENYLLPPSGGGKYSIIDDKMVLNDTAPHTAEFDWTLILNGEFDYWFDGKNLRLEQFDRAHNRHHKFLIVREDEE